MKKGFPAVPTVSSKNQSPMEGSSEPERESFQFHEDNWNKDWVVDSMKSELEVVFTKTVRAVWFDHEKNIRMQI